MFANKKNYLEDIACTYVVIMYGSMYLYHLAARSHLSLSQ